MFKISVRKLPASLGRFFLMSSWRPWAYGPWTPRPYELVIKTGLGRQTTTVTCRDPFPQTPRTDCVVHGYLSSAVQKIDDFPQMQFLDKLMTKRLVLGRDNADNCGGSAVAWGSLWRFRRCSS